MLQAVDLLTASAEAVEEVFFLRLDRLCAAKTEFQQGVGWLLTAMGDRLASVASRRPCRAALAVTRCHDLCRRLRADLLWSADWGYP
jgi:hypothetical protein